MIGSVIEKCLEMKLMTNRMSILNKKNNLIIRDFEKSDYPGIAEVNKSVFPDKATTAEEYSEFDQKRHKKCKHRRWVATVDDAVVGTGTYTQNIYQYHPHKFKIWIVVNPDFQNQKIGTNLYNQIYAALEEFDPISILTEARDDMSYAIRFLQSRGFEEFQRYSEPHLEIASFDFTPYKSLEQKLNSRGIEIKTMRQLENDPGRDRKLYELDNEIAADLPDEETFTPISFETFEKQCLKASYTLPDAYFVAVDGDKYIGTSAVNKYQAEKDLDTGITGVTREYRRKGIATCLKVKTIEYAKRHNYAKICTDNQSTNEPMLNLNNRLGFIKKYDWICVRKVLRYSSD